MYAKPCMRFLRTPSTHKYHLPLGSGPPGYSPSDFAQSMSSAGKRSASPGAGPDSAKRARNEKSRDDGEDELSSEQSDLVILFMNREQNTH
jgi:hypothetical protein